MTKTRIAINLFDFHSASGGARTKTKTLIENLESYCNDASNNGRIKIDLLILGCDKELLSAANLLNFSNINVQSYITYGELYKSLEEKFDVVILPFGFLRPGALGLPTVTLFFADDTDTYESGPHRSKRDVNWSEMQESALRSQRILTTSPHIKNLILNIFRFSSDQIQVRSADEIVADIPNLLSELDKAIKTFSGPRSNNIEPINPKFAIVTPSFNQANFLRKTIDSVLSQEYQNFDYIVVDGASSDNTVEILKSYGDRIKWISERDSGYASAVNKGFSNLDGQYLMWLPSDDTFFDQHSLARIAEAINCSNADVVYGDSIYVDENGRWIGSYRTTPYSDSQLRSWCIVAQPSCAFRSELFKKAGGLNEKLKSIADYELWLKFSGLHASFFRMGYPNSKYRLHAHSITVTSSLRTYGEIFSMELARFGRVYPGWISGAIGDLIRRIKFEPSDIGHGRRLVDLRPTNSWAHSTRQFLKRSLNLLFFRISFLQKFFGIFLNRIG